MKLLKITSSGDLPKFVDNLIKEVQPLSIKEAFVIIDHEIDFYVCELRECHGNVNKHAKNAWLCDKNNLWSVNFNG